MRPKPNVDAVNVKRVGAHRKRADVVVVLELQKANGALTVAAIAAALGSIDGERNSLDNRLIESVRREHVEGIGRLEEIRRVEREGIQVAGGGRRKIRSGTAAAAPPAAPTAVVKAEEVEDGRDEVAGDEAGVGDDQEGRSDDHNHGN